MATINPDLLKERQNGTFNVETLTHILDGDEYVTERRRYVGKTPRS